MTHFALIREVDQPVKLLALHPNSGRDFVLTSFAGQREWYGICILYTYDAADDSLRLDLCGRRYI